MSKYLLICLSQLLPSSSCPGMRVSPNLSSVLLCRGRFIIASGARTHPVRVNKIYKSHNTPVPLSRLHHFGTEMCTFLFQNGALWETGFVILVYCHIPDIALVKIFRSKYNSYFNRNCVLVQIMAWRQTSNNHCRKQGFHSLFTTIIFTRSPCTKN